MKIKNKKKKIKKFLKKKKSEILNKLYLASQATSTISFPIQLPDGSTETPPDCVCCEPN